MAEGIRYQLSHPLEAARTVGRKVRGLYSNDRFGIFLVSNRRPMPPYVWPIAQNVYTQRFMLVPPLAWFTGEVEPTLEQHEIELWQQLGDRYFYGAGAAALLAAVVCLLRRNRACLVLIMAALGWTVLFGFIPPSTRFHFALGPVISILAGAFLVFVWDGAWVAWRWLVMQVKGTRLSRSEAG